MNKIEYTYADPTGNITLLVESKVNKGDYKHIADSLMKQEPLAEQVGFVSVPKDNNEYDIELNMAGGEFCGNATMSAAALFYSKVNKIPTTVKNKEKGNVFVRVKVSGAKNIISVKVRNAENTEYKIDEDSESNIEITREKASENTREITRENAGEKTGNRTEERIEKETGSFLCELEMPGVKAIRDAKTILHTEGTIVELDGITHLIVTNSNNTGKEKNDRINKVSINADNAGTSCENQTLSISDKGYAEQKIKEFCHVLKTECMGIMFVDEDKMTINALVYVPGADTLFWENSCASGTVASGAWYFDKQNNETRETDETKETSEISFTHPGGNLSIRKTTDGRYFLGGKVSIYAGRELK